MGANLAAALVDGVREPSAARAWCALIGFVGVAAAQKMAQVSHILVTDLPLCESLKAQIADGADFAAVAAEHSACPSSVRLS